MTNEEYIQIHRCEDTRVLALQQVPEGVNIKFCLQQIEGWQVARRKLPSWAARDELLYPSRLAMEQCSSEATALYKREIVERLLPDADSRRKMADLTGGLGVDFSFLAPCFASALYVEQQEQLCAAAQHNFPLLGLFQAQIVHATIDADSPFLKQHFSFVFLDPARRDEMGKKTVFIADCSPNIQQLHDALLCAAPVVMVKLSPMLDIAAAMRDLPCVSEVHVVSVGSECKELLLILSHSENCRVYCVNLDSEDPVFSINLEGVRNLKKPHFIDTLPSDAFLYEPNASILKAGVQDALCFRFPLEGKLHPHSHLYVSRHRVADFPGRVFRIMGWSRFDKQGLKSLLHDVRQANLTLRNFPSTSDALRRRLRLHGGGNVYLFATTLSDGSHVLIRCAKD